MIRLRLHLESVNEELPKLLLRRLCKDFNQMLN